MNSDPVLSNMELIDNQHFMHYFNSDQYMPNNTEHMAPMGDSTSQATMHYMHNKAPPMNKSLPNMMNYNMSTMATQPMMASPQMQPQCDSGDNQIRYCKVPPGTIHFDTPPTMQQSYQTNHLANHHSPSHNRADLNHFNDSVNISGTITHISETDNSNPHNNYVPTPPQSQQPPLGKHSSSNNMISTPQTYSSMACHPSNNWSTIPSNIPNINSQMKSIKNGNSNQAPNFNSHEQQFSYLNQPNSEYHHSITSTPMSSSQPPPSAVNDHYGIRPSKVAKQNTISGKNQSSSCLPDLQKPKLSLNTNNSAEVYTGRPIKKDCIPAQKRNIIIFKVLEQIIDPATKNILKESVIKNEEMIIPLGQVSYDLLNRSSITTMTSTMMTVGSSGLLGDISGLDTKSTNNISATTNSIDYQQNAIKIDSTFESSKEVKRRPSELAIDTSKSCSEKSMATPNSAVDENDEEARRQTATALLSLQSVSNNSTPIKPAEDYVGGDVPTTEIIAALSSASKVASSLDDDVDTSSEEFPICCKLKPGTKVLAKWKDKNFYPAEISKQIETHKWSVKFEDQATRNLFETEIIRVEYLLTKQEVMLTLSGDLCTRASIKKTFNRSNKIAEFELEYFNEDKSIVKRYKLKDIFLNAEQGAAILNKISKPNSTGAVFADVDLDNIVVGKRARKADCRKKQPDTSSSSDSDGPTKKKKKVTEDPKVKESVKIVADLPAAKNDYQSVGHYHESSLSVSPRSMNPSLSMPASELEMVLGPLPRTKIFCKINFILTSGDRNKNVFSEHESSPERSTPFDKVYLTKQILAGGGKVFDTFEDMKSSNENTLCVLIADTYYRSIKYIQCLAAGIPIASHLWVIDSCREGKLLDRDSYILPAGYSVITHSLSSDKSTLKKSSVLFKGMRFYFGSKSADKLEKLWTPVLYSAQAIMVKQDPNMHINLTRKLVDIIIGDASCSPDLVKRAKQVKIPIISSEYIVQCLINGRKLPYDACPFFSYSHK